MIHKIVFFYKVMAKTVIQIMDFLPEKITFLKFSASV